jgi:hypothetical protein
MKIELLPNYFLNKDGTFNIDDAILLSGKIAGVCYDKEGFSHLQKESAEKTKKRVAMTLNNGHHSVYDHISISLNIKNIPKILAMVINNEHQYTTSEKSARYTKIVSDDAGIITEAESMLYEKWIDIFKEKIKELYGSEFNDSKVGKLAQENARYLVTVFMPTEMIYSTSLRQINYIASWLKEYMSKDNKNDFEEKLSKYMGEFISELERLNLLNEGLMKNNKFRTISLFGTNLDKSKDYFSNIYETTYKASFAYFAQAQRHRTLDYKMQILKNKEYFIPPIIEDDKELVSEWLNDMDIVSSVYPQGELVLITESGKYEDFILKCKERLCSSAQLEIMNKTKEILHNYSDYLNETNNPLAKDIKKYLKGARCTFKDFICTSDCKFKTGKLLNRKI